jgi:hypothetical protein
VYEDSEIALLCLQTYNSIPNINETNNTICFQKDEKLELCLRPGCYEIEDVINEIKYQLKIKTNSEQQKNIDLDMWVDKHDFRCNIKCDSLIYFPVTNSLASVLGFTQSTYENAKHGIRSEKAVNINSVNSIKVICDIAQGSFNNNDPSHSIYEFFPTVESGAKIVQSPSNLIYYPILNSTIDSIRVNLVDQENNPIQNFEEKLTIVLHIKRYG